MTALCVSCVMTTAVPHGFHINCSTNQANPNPNQLLQDAIVPLFFGKDHSSYLITTLINNGSYEISGILHALTSLHGRGVLLHVGWEHPCEFCLYRKRHQYALIRDWWHELEPKQGTQSMPSNNRLLLWIVTFYCFQHAHIVLTSHLPSSFLFIIHSATSLNSTGWIATASHSPWS